MRLGSLPVRTLTLGVIPVLLWSTSLLGTPAAAWAFDKPVVVPSAVPEDGTPGPVYTLRQAYQCKKSKVLPGTDFRAPYRNAEILDLTRAWRYSRGDGQLVAVIDTGVAPHPRLGEVTPGGDYISAGGDGLEDCDAHGTLVAGVIAARPTATDSFSGVAPDASILSIRQYSKLFQPINPIATGSTVPNGLQLLTADLETLAQAIVHAAKLGATVIAIPRAICLPAPATTTIDQSVLGAAIWYAATVEDAVVVAASGDVEGNCKQNSLYASDSSDEDPAGWSRMITAATPAWYSDFVLSVTALDQKGQPARGADGSPLSLAGVWVSVAAPGTDVISLDPRGPGLINAHSGSRGAPTAIHGTSYAAAAAAGLAALVRARFPELSAVNVIDRIKQTASGGTGSNLIGSGSIAPVAALTQYVQPKEERRQLVETQPSVEVPTLLTSAVDKSTLTALFGLLAFAVLVLGAITLKSLSRRED
ncbi:type VII secretion-associated serine protease mycosin [Mycobacterium sp.]|uniref:type VII secretion-associated serine protease mycosin n=1 Tax=Mycobacterium sp. TaxID=1785 RepID=UPI003BA87808